jgi:hypothetical protein
MPKNIRESRLQPVEYLPGAHQFPGGPALAGGIPAGGAAVSGSPGFSRWDTEEHPGVPASAGGIPAGAAPTSGSPGFSRWNTCRGRSLLPGKPDPATAGTPVGRRSGVPAAPIMFWSPGFSRWNTCRGRSLLPGKPGPAKAGTPVGRRSGVPASAGGIPKNIRESRRQPVEYLPGRGILPGKPGPAKAGTPVGRRSGVPAAPIMFWSPGFSRWNTCRGRSSFRASRR